MIKRLCAFLGGHKRRLLSRMELHKVLMTSCDASALADWSRSLSDPNGYYLDCVRFFHSAEFPDELRQHRAYFTEYRRGFGESAFHVMWWLLFCRFRPTAFLEIGVYRGQTLSLASLIQRRLNIEGHATGVSPFSSAGDSVSSYRNDVDYLQDTLANFAAFHLPSPELVRAFSTENRAAERIKSQAWHAAYIDGNHEYEVAKADWLLCSEHVRGGGIVVLDDSALGTQYKAPQFATAGHPGPSRLAGEIDSTRFREILRVGHNRVFQKV